MSSLLRSIRPSRLPGPRRMHRASAAYGGRHLADGMLGGSRCGKRSARRACLSHVLLCARPFSVAAQEAPRLRDPTGPRNSGRARDRQAVQAVALPRRAASGSARWSSERPSPRTARTSRSVASLPRASCSRPASSGVGQSLRRSPRAADLRRPPHGRRRRSRRVRGQAGTRGRHPADARRASGCALRPQSEFAAEAVPICHGAGSCAGKGCKWVRHRRGGSRRVAYRFPKNLR